MKTLREPLTLLLALVLALNSWLGASVFERLVCCALAVILLRQPDYSGGAK